MLLIRIWNPFIMLSCFRIWLEKPKEKPTAEKYVQHLEPWLLEELKKNIYPGLEAINRVGRKIIKTINAEVPKGWQFSRMETFKIYDQPQMKTLSDCSFTLCDYKCFAHIPNNYHIFCMMVTTTQYCILIIMQSLHTNHEIKHLLYLKLATLFATIHSTSNIIICF